MTEQTPGKTWFITGASRGFGREWAIAALERGDQVAATARDTCTLDDLVEKYGDAAAAARSSTSPTAPPTSPPSQQAHEHFGRLDVVVNNAGYGHFGFVEELTEAGVPRPARDQPLRRDVGDAGRAAVPARAGLGPHHPGVVDRRHLGVPAVGAYHASKWALEGFCQALAQEVAGFGIHVTLIEPGGFSTDWGGPSAKHSAELPAYAELAREDRRGPQAARRHPGRPHRLRRRHPQGRRRRRAAAARLLRRGPPGHREGRLRVAPRDAGSSGSTTWSSPRADGPIRATRHPPERVMVAAAERP